MAAPVPSVISPSATAVELAGVDKTFRQRQYAAGAVAVLRGLFRPEVREVAALRAVDLRVRRGEIVAYAGPNGAGKSTTINLLSGMLAPTRGRVRALGMDPVRDRTRYVGRIGVVFGQRTELWWDHPVAASFEWKRVIWEIPRARYDRMASLVRELLDLDPFMQTMARQLSLGQRMRADLALALLPEPELLLLDEPTLGLDVLARQRLLAFIRRINREQGVTVLVTSHDMAELEQLAGRIVLIHQGRIAFDGDFDRLRREHGDRRHLFLQTGSDAAPPLTGAELVASEAGRHEYRFDAAQVKIAALLEEAGSHASLQDVETHRAPIDEVVASIYRGWQSG